MDAINPKSTGTYRAAMAAVIILSLLLVLGVIALVAGFVRQSELYMAGHAAAGHATPASDDAAAAITLAPGAHIVSASTDAGKLVLQVQTRTGGEVDVLDLATGRLTASVKDGKP